MATMRKPKKADVVLDTIARALRPIPYWVGYKNEKYFSRNLREAAIVAELRDTLKSNARTGWRVLCEEQYKKIHAKRGSTQERADLVIRAGKNGPCLAVIEVKRNAKNGNLERMDLMALAQVRSLDSSIRMFFVQVTEAGRPREGLSERGKADRAIREPVGHGRKVRVRGAYRAVFAQRSEESGRRCRNPGDRQSTALGGAVRSGVDRRMRHSGRKAGRRSLSPIRGGELSAWMKADGRGS